MVRDFESEERRKKKPFRQIQNVREREAGKQRKRMLEIGGTSFLPGRKHAEERFEVTVRRVT